MADAGRLLGASASVAAHGAIAFVLLLLPREPPHLSSQLDLDLVEPAPPPPEELPPEPEPPPPPAPEPPLPRIAKRAPRTPEPPPPPAPEPPPEAPSPPEAPEELPVFDMDSSSFSQNGSFAINAGPGNSRFAPVGRATNPSSRPARPEGVPGGTGSGPPTFAPPPPVRIARNARVLREVRAPYPEQARSAGIEGVVLLQVEVGRSGAIHTVRVLSDPGYGLGAAAARALRSFRFSPARDQAGQPADSRFTYTYRFELDY